MTALVIITGVSRGLGRELAEQVLAEPDTRVLGLGRSGPAHERFRLRACDLRDLTSLPSAAEMRGLIGDAEQVTLVHNAGVIEPIARIGHLDPVAVDHAVRINLTAPMILTNALVAAEPKQLKVVFVSSGAAHRVIDGWSVYSTAKRGGEEFFAHLQAQGIPAVSVNPGVMDTGMQGVIREASFAGQQRFHDLHNSGELPHPAAVARRIIEEHLVTRPVTA